MSYALGLCPPDSARVRPPFQCSNLMLRGYCNSARTATAHLHAACAALHPIRCPRTEGPSESYSWTPCLASLQGERWPVKLEPKAGDQVTQKGRQLGCMGLRVNLGHFARILCSSACGEDEQSRIRRVTSKESKSYFAVMLLKTFAPPFCVCKQCA